MNFDKICYGCFREKEEAVCPYCGYDNNKEQSFLALPVGTVLNGRYLTGRVLGIGGFGITYLGYDLTLEIKVAIKEYMPSGLATRHSDRYSVVLAGGDESSYRGGEERFLDEARILAKLHTTPNIVTVYNYFRENNTAYFVMEYIEGKSLKELLAQSGGKLPYGQALSILVPVMEALGIVHNMKLLHRDISPDNIYITSKGESRLLDFGAARFAMGDNKSVSVILKHGYAPEEQYSSHGNQGPWTDVYAMGATFYHCLTGSLPPDSIERIHKDNIASPKALGAALPDAAEKAILKALSVRVENRFQTMDDFIQALPEDTGNYAVSAKTGGSTSKTASSKTVAAGGSVFKRTTAKNAGGGSGNTQVSGDADGNVLQKLLLFLSQNKKLALMVGGGVAALLLVVVISVSVSHGKAKNSRDEIVETVNGTSVEDNSTGQSSNPSGGSTVNLPENQEGASGTGADVAGKEITSANGEFKIRIPADYTEDMQAYRYSKNNSYTVVDVSFVDVEFNESYSLCLYEPADAEKNMDLIAKNTLENASIGESGYYKDAAGRKCFAMYFSGTNAKGSVDMVQVFIPSGGAFGCYRIQGVWAAGDTAQKKEIMAIIDSFEPLKPFDSEYTLFEDQSLGFKLLYHTAYAAGGVQKMDGGASGTSDGKSTVPMFLAYMDSSQASFLEVEKALYAENKEQAIQMIYELVGSQEIYELTSFDKISAIINRHNFLVQEHLLQSDSNTLHYYYAATDIDDVCYLIGFVSNDQNYLTGLDLLNDALRSFTPTS